MHPIDPNEIEHYEARTNLVFATVFVLAIFAAIAIISEWTGTTDTGIEMVGGLIHKVIN